MLRPGRPGGAPDVFLRLHRRKSPPADSPGTAVRSCVIRTTIIRACPSLPGTPVPSPVKRPGAGGAHRVHVGSGRYGLRVRSGRGGTARRDFPCASLTRRHVSCRNAYADSYRVGPGPTQPPPGWREAPGIVSNIFRFFLVLKPALCTQAVSIIKSFI